VARPRLEDTLARLRELRSQPDTPEALAALRQVLSADVCFAVAKAAAIAGEHELVVLGPDLAAAFPRFLRGLPKSDPGCEAKLALAQALRRVRHHDTAPLLLGLRHVQREPVFGGSVDTAGPLRAECAAGLLTLRHPDALLMLADLLADPEPAARAGAARGLAAWGARDGAALLRLRVLAGEDDARVLGECLDALLHLDPAGALPFAARLLDSTPERAEAAALALGASRLPEAFGILRDWLERTADSGLRRTALLAVATLRREEALTWLIALLREDDLGRACEAVAALALHRGDDSLRARVAAEVGRRSEPRLSGAFREAFDAEPTAPAPRR
jgi:HEAT repeat protein